MNSILSLKVRKQNLLIGLLVIAFYTGCSKSIEEPKHDINIMSFNIRYDNISDGENKWDNRKVACVNMIEEISPDVFGIQEGLEHQVEYFSQNLNNYNYEGIGRDDGQTSGEYAAIYYKKSRFNQLNSGTFWLSETPNIPSIGWDAALNRIATWVALKDNVSNKTVYVFNTHFDHVGVLAKKNSAILIIEKINELAPKDATVFITGDFNVIEDDIALEPIFKEFTNARNNTTNTDKVYSFNAWTFANGFYDIDFIFQKNANTNKYTTINKSYDIPFISDHYPILGEFSY